MEELSSIQQEEECSLIYYSQFFTSILFSPLVANANFT